MAEDLTGRSLIGGTAAFIIVKPNLVRGAGKETVRAGPVGCGGRGTTAMFETMAANKQ